MAVMKIIPATLIGAALALSACGGEDPAAAGRAEGEAQMRDAALKFARCMREQGLDFPDPKTDEDGGIQIGGPRVGDRDPAKMERAQKACQKHLDKIRPPKLSEEEQAQVKKEALAHSRCMRGHGIDFPDPEFPEEGGARVRIGPGSGLDPRSPKFQRAQKACAKELGDGPGGVLREESP
jgi:hypothetical protein